MPSEAAGTKRTSEVRSKGCPKCGTVKKSGKVSCCARGAAWFKKCGDADNANFDHTWGEGIQACSGFATSLLFEALVQPHHERNTRQLTNTTGRRAAAQQYANINPERHISYAAITNYVADMHITLAKIVIFTFGLLFNSWQVQTSLSSLEQVSLVM